MTLAPSTHPSSEVLTAYALGKLNKTDRATVALHLKSCPQCRKAVEQQSPASPETQLPATQSCGPLAAGKTAAAVNFEVPSVLADHPKFRILKELGRGGMGVVYKAEHRFMATTVALKVINPNLLDRTELVERFDREVHAAARLVHPHIVRALDADRAGELHLLVMEYVEGRSLHDLVKKKGPLSIVNACQCVRQAALGLQHAHEQGMVHRDIKPHNLMLTMKGQVKIRFIRGMRVLLLKKEDMHPSHGDANKTPWEENACPPAYCIMLSVSSATGMSANRSRVAR